MGENLKGALAGLFSTKNRYAMPEVSKEEAEKVFTTVLAYAEKHADELSAQTGISSEHLLKRVGHNPKMITYFQQEYLNAPENLEAAMSIENKARKNAINLAELSDSELKVLKHYVAGNLRRYKQDMTALIDTPVWEFKADLLKDLNAALGAAAIEASNVPTHLISTYLPQLQGIIGMDNTKTTHLARTAIPKKSMWTEEVAETRLTGMGFPKAVVAKMLTALIAAGVVIASGCVDATAPETTIDSLDAPSYYSEDINELAASIKENTDKTDNPNIFEKGGMKIYIDTPKDSEKVISIRYTDHLGTSLIVTENDNSNGFEIDEVEIRDIDGNIQLVKKPVADAETPIDDAATDEVYKLIRDGEFDKEAAKNLLGQPVNILKITDDLGPTPFEPQENAPYVLEYESDKFKEIFELEKYSEFYGINGRLTGILIAKDTNNAILVTDDGGESGNVFLDGTISCVRAHLNGEKIDLVE